MSCSLKYPVFGLFLVLLSFSCMEKESKTIKTAKNVATCSSNLPSRFGTATATLQDTIVSAAKGPFDGKGCPATHWWSWAPGELAK